MTSYRSKSETPKSQRAPHLPVKLIQPDPHDYFATASYIDQQAAAGDFTSAPGGTVGVLHYIWRHTVRSLKGLGPDERVGYMLTGKANLPKIATENYISLKQAGRILTWLDDEKWVKKILGKGNDLSVAVLMRQGLADLTYGLTDRRVRTESPEATDSQTGGVGTESPDNTGISTSTFTGTSTSPAGPVSDDAAGNIPSGEEPEPYIHWDDPDDGGAVAEALGVTVASIGEPFRVWLESFLASIGYVDGDELPGFWEAAQKASGARTSQVGYFKAILPGFIEQHRAAEEEQERDHAAWDDAQWAAWSPSSEAGQDDPWSDVPF